MDNWVSTTRPKFQFFTALSLALGILCFPPVAISQKKVVSSSPKVPAELDAKNLENWKDGHEFDEVFKAVADAKFPREKGEFEKLDEWNKRLEAAMDRSVYKGATLRFNDRFAFYMTCFVNTPPSTFGCGADYDPETEKLHVRFNLLKANDGGYAATLSNDTVKRKGYVGQNSFGVKKVVKVETEYENVLSLSLTTKDDVSRQKECARNQHDYAWGVLNTQKILDFDIPLSNSDASKGLSVGLLKLLFVGRLRTPLISTRETESEPTISVPLHTTTRKFVIHQVVEQVVAMTVFGKEPLYVNDITSKLPCARTEQ